MPTDFEVDLDRLLTLRSKLSALHLTLTEGPTAARSIHTNLDARAYTSTRLRHANTEADARYAYGRLDESNPLGIAHEQVSASVSSLLDALQAMVSTMIAAAGQGEATYGEAENSVRTAIDTAATATELKGWA